MRALNVDDMATAQIYRERLQTIDAAVQEIQVHGLNRLLMIRFMTGFSSCISQLNLMLFRRS